MTTKIAEIMTPLSHRETFPVPKPNFNTAWYLQLDDDEKGEKRNWTDPCSPLLLHLGQYDVNRREYAEFGEC